MTVAAIQEASVNNWENEPVLSVEHLTMRFGGLVAINDLSFDVGRGDITALIGPNGAGKTTVFNCVTGFYKPTEGRIVMRHGQSRKDDLVAQVTRSGDQWRRGSDGAVFLLERMADSEIAEKARIARTFQNIRLFGGMTVLENLLVAQHNSLMAASAFTIGGILGLPGYRKAEREAIDKATYWLERTNLIDRADDPASDLPYGDQRRLEIARAMCTGPHILCLDEPAAGLNPRESAELNALLQRIRDEDDTSVLLIEHDMGVVMEISDHIVVLDYGEKISDGDADFVRNDPAVIAAYLGVDDEEEVDIPEVRQDVAEILPAGKSKPASKKHPTKSVAAKAPVKRTKASAAAKTARSKTSKSKPVAAKPARAKADGRPPRMRKPAKPDDLKRISGVGPKLEGVLNGLGIYKFEQVAAWKKAERDWVDDHLNFKGRIERDDWVRQAKALAKETAKAAKIRCCGEEKHTQGRQGMSTTDQPLLSIRGVETFYGKIIALRGVDVEVNDGEIVTLIGANGAGKSTLMMTICGNPQARNGEIHFNGNEITGMPTHEIMQLGIAQSPEGRRIFPRMTVMENLLMGAMLVDDTHFDEDLKRVFDLFPRLKERAQQRGGTLSGV